MLLSGLCLATTQAQEFWFPNAPKNSSTTVVRPGRTGIGIPTASFNAFNTSTGRYTVANRVGFLVQGSNFTDVFNIGHLLTGDYGEEKVGDVWTSVGGPGSPGISGLPLYGTRHQFDRYSVNMALAARNIVAGSGSSSIRDAILFWDASPSNNSRMYIGKTLGSGRISPDIVINPNGRVGFGTDAFNIGSGSNDTKLKVRGTTSREDLLLFVEESTSSSQDNYSFGVGTGNRTNPALYFGSRAFGSNLSGLIATPATNIMEIGFDRNGRIDPLIILTRSISGDKTAFGADLWPESGTINIGQSSTIRSFNGVFGKNFVTISDRRAKKEVNALSYGLEHIQKLKPVTYQWKDSQIGGTHVGLIAQEVMEVIPEAVHDPFKSVQYDEDGKVLPIEPDSQYGIRYHELIPVMIKAMQEMSQAMEKQETKIQEQESRIEEQDKIIASLLGENTRTVDEGMGKSIGSPALELFQNTPNPFDQSTTIRYSLPEGTQKAELFVYDINGQQVRSMELTEAGEGAMTLTAGELGAGIYFYTLYADGEVSQTRKMILTE